MDYEAEPAAFEASEPIQTEVTEGLSYDDTVEYDEQLPAGGALAARIGKGRVYTPADAGLPPARAAGKVRATTCVYGVCDGGLTALRAPAQTWGRPRGHCNRRRISGRW